MRRGVEMRVTYCSICNAPDDEKPCKLYGNITDCWFWNDTIEIKDEDLIIEGV